MGEAGDRFGEGVFRGGGQAGRGWDRGGGPFPGGELGHLDRFHPGGHAGGVQRVVDPADGGHWRVPLMRSKSRMAWTTYRPVSAVGTRAWTVMWYWFPAGGPAAPRPAAARYWSASAPGLMPGASRSPRSVPPMMPVRSPMVSRTSRNRS